MTVRIFFDTNVLVYMFDSYDPAKQTRAQEVFRAAASAGTILLSTQVLQEFFVVVTRRLTVPLPAAAAVEVVRELGAFPVVVVDPDLILRAASLSAQQPVSFWDALIVESASAGGAQLVYSEDMQDGWNVAAVTVKNPFA